MKNNSIKYIKADIENYLTDVIGLSSLESSAITTSFFDTLQEVVREESVVKFSTFGTFKPKVYKNRKARNFKTGLDIEVPAHKKMFFIKSKI